jgi:predicted ABC-type ATPase
MFAGPNGSGKSSLYERLRKDAVIHTDTYVAADRIEADIRRKKKFVFNAYRIKVDESEFKSFVVDSGILSKYPLKNNLLDSVHIKSGVLKVSDPKFIDSYLASCIAGYLSEKLIETGQSFCLETVMSHPSKIKVLKQAKKLGFKTYLYFVFTDDPNLNVKRVEFRVKGGGHGVAKEKITSRYERSLGFLPDAVKNSDEAFIIDNSSDFVLVAEIEKGKRLKFIKHEYGFRKNLPDFYKTFKKVLK